MNNLKSILNSNSKVFDNLLKKQKSKKLYEKIVKMKVANKEIKLEAQKRLQRDFSD